MSRNCEDTRDEGKISRCLILIIPLLAHTFVDFIALRVVCCGVVILWKDSVFIYENLGAFWFFYAEETAAIIKRQ